MDITQYSTFGSSSSSGQESPTPRLQAFIDYCDAIEGSSTSTSAALPQKRAAETASCAKRIALEYPGPAALEDLTKKLQDEAEQRRLELKKEKARGEQM